MKKTMRKKAPAIVMAWLLAFSMAIPTVLPGIVAKAADTEAETTVTDEDQMNMAMPYITTSSGAKLVAAKDFTSANGRINGTGTYNKETEVDLTDKTIMDKALTLEEVKNLNKSISVVFRAKVNAPVSALTSPVLVLANKNGLNFKKDSTGKQGGTAVYLCGAPGTLDKISTFTRKDGSTVSSGSTHYNVSGKGLITNDGQWHTVAFVHKEEGFVYYVDGEAVLTNATDKMLADDTKKIGDLFDNCDNEKLLACFGTFGGTGYNNTWNFNGLMDYYQLYDGALSATEVKILTNKFGPTTKVYTKEEIESNYRISDGSKIAPTLEGYVFGGWYKTEDYEQEANALLEGEALTQDKYYALFVPETVLGVKAQVTNNLLDHKRGDDSIGAIRFATSVDSKNYQKVGFIFNFEGSTEKDWEAASTTVYHQMFAYNPATGDKEAAETKYTPGNTFSPASKYFKTYTFYDLSAKLYDVNITARPFWITLDGTKVFGRDAIKTVNMGRRAKTIYIASDGSDLTADGSKTNPYGTLEYALEQASTGDVIYVKDQVTITTNGWTVHGKDVMITGDTLDFSTLKTVNIKDAVTLTNMNVKFQDGASVFANGNRYRVDQNTNITGYTILYGGSNRVQVESTDVTLLAGDYSRIFGGGVGANSTVNVLGDTNLYIGGEVNKTKDLSGTNACLIFGGSNNGDIKGSTNVYVGGNVNINQNLTADKELHTVLYGGSSSGVVYGDTNLKVSDNAQFNRIVGGSTSGTVKGATHVTVEGNVNSKLNNDSHVMNHAALIGGCVSSTTAASVEGGTYITINGSPRFVQIYGGGAQLDTGKNTVTDTHVEVTEDASDAKIMSIFGGSYNIKTKSNVEVKNTSVVIKAGTVAQVFGGCYRASMTGNTNIQILGGTITRRIYGGCYNDWDWDWETTCHVTGNTNVTIGSDAILKLNDSDGDCGLLAGSRYKETFDGEVGTIVFLNGANTTLGRRDYTSLLGNPKAYNYLIKASSGGTVTTEGNTLRMKPDEGKNMTVVGAAPELQSDGSYNLALPNIGKNGQQTITVSF